MHFYTCYITEEDWIGHGNMLQPLAMPCLDLMLFVHLCDCTEWHKVHLELTLSSYPSVPQLLVQRTQFQRFTELRWVCCLPGSRTCLLCKIRTEQLPASYILVFCCCLCATFDTVIASSFAVDPQIWTFFERSSVMKSNFISLWHLSLVCCRFDQKYGNPFCIVQ